MTRRLATTRRSALRRRPVAAPARLARTLVLALAAVAAGGCDTIGADLNDAFTGLFPPSPTQAVDWSYDPDPDLRRRGILLLANATFGGERAYVPLYRDYATNEPNPLVKAAAIRALARHGEVADARLIAVQLTHENRQVRWEAARGLQRLHDPDVVPDLLERLRDPDEDVQVRVASATALGQYGSDRSFQGLVSALDAPDLAVNVAASEALATMTGVDRGGDPTAWLAWYAEAGEGAAVLAGADGYLYPTYRRDPTWLERVAFWNSRVREFPGPPRGLEPVGRRSTYADEDSDPDRDVDEGDGGDGPAGSGDAASPDDG